MEHRFSLDARTSHILLCHCAHGLSVYSDTDDVGELKDALSSCMLLKPRLYVVAFLDCIELYGLPGAKGAISALSDNRRHDFSNLRHIIYTFLMLPGEHLKAQTEDLRQRAARTMIRQRNSFQTRLSQIRTQQDRIAVVAMHAYALESRPRIRCAYARAACLCSIVTNGARNGEHDIYHQMILCLYRWR